VNAVKKIAWREKFVATGIHFLVTLTLAACAAALVFLVWFPDPFQALIGGTQLFVLVVGCDLVLGPLVSLVIYNSRKSRGKLVFDYVVIGILQITALIYGVSVLAGSRPVFVAFSVDRLEIVTAREITDKELAAVSRPEFAKLSITGPRLAGIDVPQAERSDALFQALQGNDIYLRPKFFVPYETMLAEIRKRARPLSSLTERKPASAPLIEAAIGDIKLPADRIRWVPAHHSKGFLTALIDIDSGKPVGYIAFDPY
jgi:hypothetical protein